MSTKIVDDGLIQKTSLYKPVFWLFRLDVVPFVVLYAVFFALTLSGNNFRTQIGLIVLPILFSLHLFLFLMAQWSVQVRCALGYKLVKDVDQAEIVHVAAAQNAGMDRLVKLTANNYFSEAKSISIMNKTYQITRERLDFQKVVYHFDSDKNTFARLDYPTSATAKNILDWRGHAVPHDVGLSLMRWGTNEYDIPIPNFLDLYLVRASLIRFRRILHINAVLLCLFCNRTIWWRLSLYSKCCVSSCGVSMTTGTTVSSHC